MINNKEKRKYHLITERYCHVLGENVVLRSSSPNDEDYECLHAVYCEKSDTCERAKKKKGD